MEIKPCKDDIGSLIGAYVVVTLCEVFWLFLSEFNTFFVVLIILLGIALYAGLIRDTVYLCRTVSLDSDGCTFSLGKQSKKYGWHESTVQLCGDKDFSSYDSDVSGAGILICPKSVEYSGRVPYMTFCRRRKPFSSVYIRFTSSVDERKITTGKAIYYGYTSERETVTDHLKSIGVL